MALAHALQIIEDRQLACLTNYGEFLERFPPTHEVMIVQESSWSCVHGVERWRSDCGCNSGGHPGWRQSWRAPLREALDWLQHSISPRFETAAFATFGDPWAARDAYITAILNRGPEHVSDFLATHALRALSERELEYALKLMELQRHLLLMYTSCGWFFDDISGIETIQVITYAGRAIQLAENLGLGSYESDFIERLAKAASNDPAHRDGALIYEQFVTPAITDLTEVGAHFALASLFDGQATQKQVYCYDADVLNYERTSAGRAKFAVGRARLRSRVTWEEGELSFAALHLGDHNLAGGVRAFISHDRYAEMARELGDAFGRADFPEVIRLIDHHFGDHAYSLVSLFRDEQRRVTDIILDSTLLDIERGYRQIYEDNAALIRYLVSVGAPIPPALRTAAEFVMNLDLQRAFTAEPLDTEYVSRAFRDTHAWGLLLDVPGLSHAFELAIERIAARVARGDAAVELLDRLSAVIALTDSLPFTVDVWTTQNDFYRALQAHYSDISLMASQGDRTAATWIERFQTLGEQLHVRVPV
jgi:hypothetical protein